MDWDTLPNGDMNHTGEIRVERMPAPTAGIFDTPLSCGVRINSEWLSFIIARLEILTDPRCWLGDDATTDTAAQQMELLLEALSESQECLYPMPEILNPLTSTPVQINIPDDPVFAEIFFSKLEELMEVGNYDSAETEDIETVAGVWAEVLDTAQENYESGVGILPASFRVNDGMIEYQPYGGAGWEVLGDACPCPPSSLTTVYNPDIVNPDELACAIATNLGSWLIAKSEDQKSVIEAAISVGVALDGILAVFGNIPGYIIVDQVTDLIKEAFDVGLTQWEAFLTVEYTEAVQEWIYCRLADESPPNMNEEIWEEFKVWNDEEYDAGNPVNVGAFLQAAAYRGISYMAIEDRARIASYDSGNCVGFACAGWEKVFDFTTSSAASQGWENDWGLSHFEVGIGMVADTWNRGGGAYTKSSSWWLDWGTDTDATEVEIEYTWLNVGGGNTSRRIEAKLNGTLNQTTSFTDNPAVININNMIDRLLVALVYDSGIGQSGADNASIILKKVTIRGIGDNPFD